MSGMGGAKWGGEGAVIAPTAFASDPSGRDAEQRYARRLSIAELLAVEVSSANRAAGRTSSEGVRKGGADASVEWFGVPLEELRDKLLNGWPEGLAKAREALGHLVSSIPSVASVRRHAHWSSDGDELHMDRVLSGHLDEAWRTTRREATRLAGPATTMRVAVELQCSTMRKASDLFWRGAVASLIVDALEQSGRSVELVGYSWTGNITGAVKDWYAEVLIKGAGDPMNLATVAAWTCLPGAHRSCMFRLRESLPWVINMGYGHSHEGERPPRFEDAPQLEVRGIWNLGDAKAAIARLLSSPEVTGDAVTPT